MSVSGGASCATHNEAKNKNVKHPTTGSQRVRMAMVSILGCAKYQIFQGFWETPAKMAQQHPYACNFEA